MKRSICVLILILLLPPSAALAGDGYTGNFNWNLGWKYLGHDWDPAYIHGDMGFGIDFKAPSWPVSFAANFNVTAGAGISVTSLEISSGRTIDLNLGAKKYFGRGRMHPFIGGGVSMADLEFKTFTNGTCGGQGPGYWGSGGVLWWMGSRYNLGFEMMYTASEVEYTCTKTGSGTKDAGGLDMNLVLGIHW